MRLSTLRANLNKNSIKVKVYSNFNRSKDAFAVRGVCFANLANKRKTKQKSLNLGPPCIKSHLMDDDALAPPL